MIWALWLSKPLRYAMIGLIAMASYEAWKFHQRNIGARVAVEKIEKKADANAKQADEVRSDAGRPDASHKGPIRYQRLE